MTKSTEPLVVVELAQGTAGPVCGRLFAAFGNEVVKVEPSSGDYLRAEAPVNADGLGLAFIALNADKRSVVADLGDPASRVVVDALLSSADVVITDPQSRAAAEGWLDSDALAESWPRLVVVAIEGVEEASDGLDLLADPLLAESYGGLTAMIGDPDERPLLLGGNQSAYGAGCTGFLGASAALRRRDQVGSGDTVTVRMSDIAAYMDWKSDVANIIDPEPPTRRGSNHGDWRMVRTADGWVGIIYQPWQWHLMLQLVQDVRLESPEFADQEGRRANDEEFWEIIRAWAATRAKAEIYETAQRLGLPFGYATDAADLAHSPQLLSRGFIRSDPSGTTPLVGSPVHATGLPWLTGHAPSLGSDLSLPDDTRRLDAAANGSGNPAPLEGVVVLDFGTITAGAATARLLADLGATVISVESLDHPDPFRNWRSLGPNSPYFASNNVAKSGIVIDLKTERGRELVHALAGRAHVFIENYRVGVTQRLGIDFETLHAINPDLIYLSMSSQGQEGPESRNSSYGSTIDLLSGLASITGYRAGEPMWSSVDVNYPDQLVSLLGAGVLAYCLQADRRGVYLDVSQREVVSWTMSGQIADYIINGSIAEPEGNHRPGRSPHDVYASDDQGWVAISGETDEQRTALGRLIGRAKPDDSSLAAWQADSVSVDEALARWIGSRSRDEALDELHAVGIPSVPVLSAEERNRTEGFSTRRVRIDGDVPLKGYPVRFGTIEPSEPTPAPDLGRDTRRVLTELCGLDEDELDSLEADGIITSSKQSERQSS
jgi:crotonobetainyl-CoA:carnitine CoA-transferase CaiB-like acyl-CoA transferase